MFCTLVQWTFESEGRNVHASPKDKKRWNVPASSMDVDAIPKDVLYMHVQRIKSACKYIGWNVDGRAKDEIYYVHLRSKHEMCMQVQMMKLINIEKKM